MDILEKMHHFRKLFEILNDQNVFFLEKLTKI